MLTKIPKVAATANLYGDCIGRILLALWNRREIFDKQINLPNFKTRGFETEVELGFGQDFQLFSEQLVIPFGILRQAVICDRKCANLVLGKVLKPNDGHFLDAQVLAGTYASVAGDHL